MSTLLLITFDCIKGMSSSYRLKKRIEEGWNLGHWSDMYIVTHKQCHPDFNTLPIGHVGGVKVCLRKPQPVSRKPTKEEIAKVNGWTYGSYSLYNPRPEIPPGPGLGGSNIPQPQADDNISRPPQMNNPYPIEDRWGENNRDEYLTLIQQNYYRIPGWYNGTGIAPTPSRGFPVDFKASPPASASAGGQPVSIGAGVMPPYGPYPRMSYADDLTRGIPLSVIPTGKSVGCRARQPFDCPPEPVT